MYIKVGIRNGKRCLLVIVVYVDDVLGLGCVEALHPCFAEIRREITMDDPAPMSRYLGCNHHFSKSGPQGSQVTQCVFEMSDYFSDAVQTFTRDRLY